MVVKLSDRKELESTKGERREKKCEEKFEASLREQRKIFSEIERVGLGKSGWI
jgi:hypothetical protein